MILSIFFFYDANMRVLIFPKIWIVIPKLEFCLHKLRGLFPYISTKKMNGIIILLHWLIMYRIQMCLEFVSLSCLVNFDLIAFSNAN